MNCLGGLCGGDDGVGFGVGETDCPARGALQRTMNGSRVPHEVGAGPGISSEKGVRKEIALQSITTGARQDDIARVVCTAVRERIDVVQRGSFEVKRGCTVNAPATAVAHCGALDGALVTSPAKVADARASCTTSWAGETGEHDTVMLSTNGHCTSREKPMPRVGTSFPARGI
jgi:hypothetical protein